MNNFLGGEAKKKIEKIQVPMHLSHVLVYFLNLNDNSGDQF